jgi:tetratricopeptide (TPR) repeat protein
MGTASGDLVFMGDILLESGDPDDALAKYTEAVDVMDKADVPDEVKEATRRNHLREEARVAVKKGDLETAKSQAEAYRVAVEAKQVPFELWQAHELAGMIAIEEKDFASAVGALEMANQQDPRVLYRMAVALQGHGENDKAQAMCKKAAEWNGLGVNYAYVKSKAEQMLAEAMSVK